MKRVVSLLLLVCGLVVIGTASQSYGGDSYTSTQVGNTTFYSDGTSAQRVGNTTFYSDGTTSQKVGNTTFYNK